MPGESGPPTISLSSAATIRQVFSGHRLAISPAHNAIALRENSAVHFDCAHVAFDRRLPEQLGPRPNCARSPDARRPNVGDAGLPPAISTADMPVPFGECFASSPTERRTQRGVGRRHAAGDAHARWRATDQPYPQLPFYAAP